LLKAIVAALAEVGIEANDHLEQMRREEHSFRQRDIDLVEYFYCSASEQPQEVESLIGHAHRMGYNRHYYRAFWPYSKFVFVGEAGYPVNFCITCRLPKVTSQRAKIAIELNGKSEAEFDISAQWTTWEITIPAQDVVDGLNEVIVRWPIPEFRSEEDLSKATSDLCQYKFPEFFPYFGEIHSFTASSGQRIPAEIPIAHGVEAIAQMEVS
jgi:hypothetical protein